MTYICEQTRDLNYRIRPDERISGSGQPSLSDLKEIVLPKITLLVNLRDESVAYVNKRPISAGIDRDANRTKTPDEIDDEEEVLVRKKFVPIVPKGLAAAKPVEEAVEEAIKESAIVKGFGVWYERIPIVNHKMPDNEAIDRIVLLFDRFVKEHLSIHFHCAGGKGRSSVAIALFSILESPESLLVETLNKIEEWGNSKILGCSKPKKPKKARDNPDFWGRFHQFANKRNPGDLWSTFKG